MKRDLVTHGVLGIELALVCGVAVGLLQLPYVNWHAVVPPVDAQPLTIRHDAKGDGQFQAPRSGHRLHRGVDVVAPLNSPVRAIRSGRVLEVGEQRGLGRYVVLQHGEALRSLYAHLNETRVEAGRRVRQGALIGLVGKTGNAAHPWIMPHVHLEVIRDHEPIDPATLGLDIVDPARERALAQGPLEPAEEASDGRGGD